MSVAFDAASAAHTGTNSSTGNFSWTHTPVGTPRGVLVLITLNAEAIDEISGVTYGGVAMTEITDSPLLHATGSEDGTLFGYFLGAGIPTGPQTVAVTVSGSTRAKTAEAITVTAARDTVIDDTGTFESGSSATAQVTLTTTADAVCVAAVHSGSLTSGINEDGNTTELRLSTFTGTFSFAYGRRTTSGAGSFTLGWTSGADEQAVLAAAIVEGQPSGSATASAKPQATATGQKDASGAASASAKPQATASGFGPTETHSGSAAVTGTARVTATGVADVPATFTTNKSAMML